MKGNMSITRNNRNEIKVEVMDDSSRNRFVTVSMSAEDLTMMLTGLSMVEVNFEVKGLENVGKKRLSEKRSVQYNGKEYNKKILQAWLIENCQEEGWSLDPYLGSQSSIQYGKDFVSLNYSVYKFV